MTRYFDLHGTVLIVVGHGILPEEEDRPIAYELKREINARGGGSDSRAAVVVTDVWVMDNEMGSFFPAIALGAPTANAFTAQIYEELPIVYSRDERVFIQLGDAGKRTAVWGMDQPATREAADVFVKEGMLERVLDLVWRRS